MSARRVWTPSPERVARAAMTRFRLEVEAAIGAPVPDYPALHAWSIAEPEAFWAHCARFVGLRFTAPPTRVRSGSMPHARWFEGATLNYAEHLLSAGAPDALAILYVDEGGLERRTTYGELTAEVARARHALERRGIRPGDRVAALMTNSPEAVVLYLACAAMGAIFCGCSPGGGVAQALERLDQVKPRLLVASDGYLEHGKLRPTQESVRHLLASLPSLEGCLFVGQSPGLPSWREALDAEPATPRYDALPFDHPLAILFTSGTTGLPKGLVHGAGGTLLTHAKEHLLHCDLDRGDAMLYYTSVSWMMWNWLVSALARGAAIVLYEGGLVLPSRAAIWQLVDRERVTHFGISASYLESCLKKRLRLRDELPFANLRCLMSTGSPLHEDVFDWVHDAVKPDVHLASISGGTDIVGCFMLGDPTSPVHAGQIQRPGLGVDVVAIADDETVAGPGEPGELVCRQPLPSMPVRLWGDVDGDRYLRSYFVRLPGLWCHGDRVVFTPEGGVVVLGRSDATLKPGGVRIGTAELYRPLQAVPEVLEALAAGKRERADVAIWLFVVLAPGVTLDDALTRRICDAIRSGTTPRHIPRRVFQVRELPRTANGKIVEVAVNRLINGEPSQREAVANPGSLEEIRAVTGMALADVG